MASKKHNKPKWEKVGQRWVAKLGNTVEDQIRAERAARRQAAIDSGTLAQAGKCGVHGGDKRTRTRRDRQSGKQDLRNGRYDD